MKQTHIKHFLAITALLVCNLAHAGSSTQGGASESSTMLSWTPGMRVRHYDSIRNTMTTEGYILVCPVGMATGPQWNSGLCLDTTKQNAWQRLDDVTPQGMRIRGIDYRLSGSSGYRSLFVYYVPK